MLNFLIAWNFQNHTASLVVMEQVTLDSWREITCLKVQAIVRRLVLSAPQQTWNGGNNIS